MEREPDHGALDLTFHNHRAKGGEVLLATAAVERASWKCNGAAFIRDGEADSLASEVNAKNSHGGECSGTRPAASQMLFR